MRVDDATLEDSALAHDDVDVGLAARRDGHELALGLDVLRMTNDRAHASGRRRRGPEGAVGPRDPGIGRRGEARPAETPAKARGAERVGNGGHRPGDHAELARGKERRGARQHRVEVGHLEHRAPGRRRSAVRRDRSRRSRSWRRQWVGQRVDDATRATPARTSATRVSAGGGSPTATAPGPRSPRRARSARRRRARSDRDAHALRGRSSPRAETARAPLRRASRARRGSAERRRRRRR